MPGTFFAPLARLGRGLFFVAGFLETGLDVDVDVDFGFGFGFGFDVDFRLECGAVDVVFLVAVVHFPVTLLDFEGALHLDLDLVLAAPPDAAASAPSEGEDAAVTGGG